VLGELGRGGMGVVFLARDSRLQREVAIKLLPPELDGEPQALERFLQEARTLAALDHPNIAIIHSLEESGGRHFLTMERIAGRSLWHRLRDERMSADEALAIVRQVARALEAAHLKRVVHRDLKPSNVMLRQDGTVKVLDFGLAIRVDRATREGEIAGTPGYMSPEQVRGEPVDARSDVWALGAMLYECLAGAPLVPGTTQREKLAATLALDVAARLAADGAAGPPAARLERVLARCLAVSPSERFASMHEVRLLLEEEIAERAMPRGAGVTAPTSHVPGNLPRRLTQFVGREREVQAVTNLLREHRLLTITGAGGCGKSRLSLEVAARLGDVAPDGAWLVELASLADPARLAASANTALSVPNDATGDATTALLAFVREKRLLLIFDNCEHLLDACAELAGRLLAACPSVRLLATSREALRIEGESTYVLSPLGLPATALEDSDAMQLFADRARAVEPHFALGEGNRATVAEICRKLDGIPLAIELAAARMKALSEAKILELLDDRFRLLTRGVRTAQAHQTLRALVDWSYDRLEPAEQAVLRRLSVFRGAWRLEGAESVAAGGNVADWEVLDLFTRLVEKSLVVRDLADAGSHTARYSLLETIREYAHEKLLEAPPEAAEAARRHRDYVVALAIEGFDGLKSAAQARWTIQLDDAVNDVRAVLAALAADPHAAEAELKLTSAYGYHWMKRGMWAEGREALEHALARPDADHGSAPFGQALLALGNLEFRAGEFDLARRHYEGALAVLKQVGTEIQLANVTMNLGNVDWSQGNMESAQGWYETSLEHYRRAESTVGAAGCLNNLSALSTAREDWDRVESLQSEALAIFESIGVTHNICLSLFQLGIAALVRQDFELSHARLERALALAREADNRWNILAALDNLAGLENHRDRPEAARAPVSECLVRLREMRDPVIGLSALENAASVVREAAPADAALLLAAARAQREEHQLPGLSYERRMIDRRDAELRERLGATRFAEASAQGAALTLADALTRAEAVVGVEPPSTSGRVTPPPR
jgi:non-specific serine/threonine protein kinase